MCKHPHFDPTCKDCQRRAELVRDIIDGGAALLALATIAALLMLTR